MDAKINIPNTLVQTPICDPKTGIVNEHWIHYLLTQFQYISLIKTAKNGRRIEIDATECIRVYDANDVLIAQFGGSTNSFYLHYEDGGNTITIDSVNGLKIVFGGSVTSQFAPDGNSLLDNIASPAHKVSQIYLQEVPSGVNRIGFLSLAVYHSTDLINALNSIDINQLGVITYGYFKVDDSYIELSEMTAPAAPDVDQARLFVQDNGAGKSQICVRFHTGAVQVLATEP